MENLLITNAFYVRNSDNTVVCINASVDGTEISVPLDPANRHYQAIQEWVAEGNTIQDAE